MHKGRLEAFSDAVIAIIMTVMVLELRPPHGADWEALKSLAHTFCAYLLSFVFLGIYWNNHHHMLQVARHVNGATLWANQHLLFWLSLIPLVTAWIAENPRAPWPVALYGFVLLAAGAAYFILTKTLIAANGRDSALAVALGDDFKGKISVVIYAVAIAVAWRMPAMAYALYVAVALMWLVPDRRFEARGKTSFGGGAF